MSADRAPFVCQSQSMNLFFDKVDFKTLNAAHFLGWKLGLKTGSYYIRTKSSTNAQNFAISATREKEMQLEDQKYEEETCLSCGA
jgi:ribonucleotide reductase alpha subunit